MSAAPKFAPNPRRRAMTGKIHIARKELGLDETSYRALLKYKTGRESAADCTDRQLADVLDELKAKGWKPVVLTGGRTARKAERAPADGYVAKKARALWISLHQLGVVRDPSERALERFAARQLHVDKLQWADESQGYRLIEALKAMAERAGWSQDVSGLKGPAVVLSLKRGLLAAICARLAVEPPACAPAALDAEIARAARALHERDAGATGA